MSDSNQLRLNSISTSATPSLDYINRLPTELLDYVFQSIYPSDEREFQPYRPIIARVAPKWNEMMKRITYYHVDCEERAIILEKMFREQPTRGEAARSLDVEYLEPDGRKGILQELLFRVPALSKLKLDADSIYREQDYYYERMDETNGEVKWTISGILMTLRSLPALEEFEVRWLNNGLLFDYDCLLALYSLENLTRLYIPDVMFNVQNYPLTLTPTPLFTRLTELHFGMRFCSMNDVDVVLRIIKNSEKTLKIVYLSHNGSDVDEARGKELMLQQSQDISLDYYDFNLDLASFAWYVPNGSKQAAVFAVLAKRSNLLHHITNFMYAPGAIIEVLGSMRRLHDISIRLATESIVEELDSLEILIRNNRLPKLLDLSIYTTRNNLRDNSTIQHHPLKKLCDDLGIGFSF